MRVVIRQRALCSNSVLGAYSIISTSIAHSSNQSLPFSFFCLLFLLLFHRSGRCAGIHYSSNTTGSLCSSATLIASFIVTFLSFMLAFLLPPILSFLACLPNWSGCRPGSCFTATVSALLSTTPVNTAQ